MIANSPLPELKPVFGSMLRPDPSTPSSEDREGQMALTKPLKVFAGVFKERLGRAGTSLDAFLDDLGCYSLAGLEGQITRLVITGEGEGPLVPATARAFYDKLTCPKTGRMVGVVDGGEVHCSLNNPSLKHQIEFDWLDDVFKS